MADAKSQNLAACLLLHAWKGENSYFAKEGGHRDVLTRLCQLGRGAEQNDFALLCVRHVALATDFCQLAREERILLLDLVRDLELATASQLPVANLLTLVGDFTHLTDVILTKTLGELI